MRPMEPDKVKVRIIVSLRQIVMLILFALAFGVLLFSLFQDAGPATLAIIPVGVFGAFVGTILVLRIVLRMAIRKYTLLLRNHVRDAIAVSTARTVVASSLMDLPSEQAHRTLERIADTAGVDKNRDIDSIFNEPVDKRVKIEKSLDTIESPGPRSSVSS